jgi:DNA-binding IclR family transcriptional regulator
MPAHARARILSETELHKFTDNTIVDREVMEEEARRTLDRGFAIEQMEHSPFINGVAAPVYNHDGEFVASLAAIGPTLMLCSESLLDVGARVTSVAQEISRAMGGRRT